MTTSERMARVHSRDTSPELRLRKALWHRGVRYRVDHKVEGVRVDIAFLGQRLAVFVDGCFWHGCPSHYRFPSSHTGYWGAKLRRNVARDATQTASLESAGWTVVRVLECDVRANIDEVVALVLASREGPRRDSARSRLVRVADVVVEDAGDSQTTTFVVMDLRNDVELGRVHRATRRGPTHGPLCPDVATGDV